MKIAVVNNYDSFVYNIIHYLESFDGVEVEVFLNDAFSIEELMPFDKIVLSPGPGIPKEAGLLIDVISYYKDKKSILGVCLGHQAIAEYFNCSLKNLEKPLHGTASSLKILTEDYLWEGMESPFRVGHYHSWVVDPVCLSNEIIPLALDDWGNIMALKHANWDIRGVQFHPESVLTTNGKQLLKNWIFYKNEKTIY